MNLNTIIRLKNKGILAASKINFLTLNEIVYVVVLIFPLNSLLNPFVYTRFQIISIKNKRVLIKT